SLLLPDLPPPALSPLSLHDALPICALRMSATVPTFVVFMSLGLGLGQGCRASSLPGGSAGEAVPCDPLAAGPITPGAIVGVGQEDRKSTRLNSSHRTISYAVFCLKK